MKPIPHKIQQWQNIPETMTIGELIQFLSILDRNVKVLATWEYVFCGVRSEDSRVIEVQLPGQFHPEKILVFNVENYG